MNDLKLLEALPAPVEPLDDLARQRIRNRMGDRVGRRNRHVQPNRKMAVLCAAVVVGGVASVAAAVVHPWTPDHPIAVPSGTQHHGYFTPDIPNPDAYLTSPDQVQSAATEFEGSIRLPDGGSFNEWTHHAITDHNLTLPGGGYTRVEVVQYMVNASTCQWTQQWIKATRSGQQPLAAEAARVLADMNDWATATGYQAMSNALTAVTRNDTNAATTFENGQCAYTGSWGASPSVQDARANTTLDPAIQIAQQFLKQSRDPRSFTWQTAEALDSNVVWASEETSPSPFPGVVFIAQPTAPGITLVSVSESGEQFCAVITPAEVNRGTTTNDIRTAIWTSGGLTATTPEPVTCHARP